MGDVINADFSQEETIDVVVFEFNGGEEALCVPVELLLDISNGKVLLEDLESPQELLAVLAAHCLSTTE